MRPKAEWAIDSEPIRARGIIVNYYVFKYKVYLSVSFIAPRPTAVQKEWGVRTGVRAVRHTHAHILYKKILRKVQNGR